MELDVILPPDAMQDLLRYISYGWLPGIIENVLNRTYGFNLSVAEVRHLMKEVRKRNRII